VLHSCPTGYEPGLATRSDWWARIWISLAASTLSL